MENGNFQGLKVLGIIIIEALIGFLKGWVSGQGLGELRRCGLNP